MSFRPPPARPPYAAQGGRLGAGKAGAPLRSVEVLRFDGSVPSSPSVLDAPVAVAWRPAAPMALPRTSLGAATCGGQVYAIGGQSARETHAGGEWLDPGTDTWRHLARGMSQPRKYLAVAADAGAWSGDALCCAVM